MTDQFKVEMLTVALVIFWFAIVVLMTNSLSKEDIAHKEENRSKNDKI